MTFREHIAAAAQSVVGLFREPPPKAPLANPKAFFAALKPGLFGSLTQTQVDGINAILRATAHWPIADRAYALATAYHETARTMRPIKEYGTPAYFRRMYDPLGDRPHVARELGNTVPGDGARFAGRGYVQLTGRRNYKKAGEALGINLIGKPHMALNQETAAKIMVLGMEEGWFTGRDLDDDLPRIGPATLRQFIASRDIINGTDKARKIAEEAIMFQAALIAGGRQ